MTEKIEEQIVQSKFFENMQSDTDKATFQVPGKIQHTYQMTKRPFSLAGLLSFYFFLIKEHGEVVYTHTTFAKCLKSSDKK